MTNKSGDRSNNICIHTGNMGDAMNKHAGENLQEKRPATGAVDHEQKCLFIAHTSWFEKRW
jgi:hypothetical protein